MIKFSNLFLVFLLILTISCSAEKRIRKHSYTEQWYIYENERYQVYKNKFGNKYILIFNDSSTSIKRKYI
jgi:hypothetical protein